MSISVPSAGLIWSQFAEICADHGTEPCLAFHRGVARLQCTWPGASEALRLLIADSGDSTPYQTAAEEGDVPPDAPRHTLSAEAAELGFAALDLRADLDDWLRAVGVALRLDFDGRRAYLVAERPIGGAVVIATRRMASGSLMATADTAPMPAPLDARRLERRVRR